MFAINYLSTNKNICTLDGNESRKSCFAVVELKGEFSRRRGYLIQLSTRPELQSTRRTHSSRKCSPILNVTLRACTSRRGNSGRRSADIAFDGRDGRGRHGPHVPTCGTSWIFRGNFRGNRSGVARSRDRAYTLRAGRRDADAYSYTWVSSHSCPGA